MRKTIGLLIAVVAALTTMAAGAQSNDDQIQILSVTPFDGTVTLEIAVPPTIGSVDPVADNFGLTVDGAVTPLSIDPLDNDVDVVIVVDTSGSMRGEALDAAKGAAVEFLSSLAEDAAVGVIGFGPEATVVAPLNLDRAASLAAIGSLEASGETALWDSLILAASVLDDNTSGASYVVVLSDGDDTIRPDAQGEAEDALLGASARLYAVAIDTPDTNQANLEGAVDNVGGQYVVTEDLDALVDVYSDIADRLESRYVVTFDQPSADSTAVLSVAANGEIATARTQVTGGQATTESTATTVPAVINTDDLPQLQPVVRDGVGIVSSPTLLFLGAIAIFAAIAIVGLLMALPGTSVEVGAAAVRTSDAAADANARLKDAANRIVSDRDEGGELDAALDAAGLNLRAGEFVLLALASMVVAGLIGSVLGGATVGILFLLLASFFCYLIVSVRIRRRRQRFADQLTDALGIMTGSLRSGRGLPQAIELVAQEAVSPTKEQFRRVVFETRVGRDLTKSLSDVAVRMKSQDLEWVSRAVDINRELGGDLTEVLDNVADTIRDRRKIARQVQSLSAEGRASGWVLLSLPVVMFVIQALLAPELTGALVNTGLGRSMLIGAVIGMGLGYLWIRKLVDVRY